MMISRKGMIELARLREKDLDPSLPWGGRSPRTLTRAWEKFTFRPATTELNPDAWDEEVIEEQYRRHLGDFLDEV